MFRSRKSEVGSRKIFFEIKKHFTFFKRSVFWYFYRINLCEHCIKSLRLCVKNYYKFHKDITKFTKLRFLRRFAFQSLLLIIIKKTLWALRKKSLRLSVKKCCENLCNLWELLPKFLLSQPEENSTQKS